MSYNITTMFYTYNNICRGIWIVLTTAWAITEYAYRILYHYMVCVYPYYTCDVILLWQKPSFNKIIPRYTHFFYLVWVIKFNVIYFRFWNNVCVYGLAWVGFKQYIYYCVMETLYLPWKKDEESFSITHKILCILM